MGSRAASQRETERVGSDLPSTPKPSRRRSRKREAIIGAAKEMFFLEGYAGTSMERITACAGVSKATIYSHFRSKEELLLAVVEEVVLPLRGDYLSALDASADLREWLLDLGRMLAQQVLLPDVTALERLVIAEALRFPELGRIFQTTAVNMSLQLLRPRIERALAEGVMRPCDPILALEHFAEMCAGRLRRKMLLNEGSRPTDAEIRRHVEDVVVVFLHGYGASAAMAGEGR